MRAGTNMEAFTLLCPACGVVEVVDIRLNVAGSELALRHCPTCDTRWWSDEDGRQVELTSVLELASRTRRRRRSS